MTEANHVDVYSAFADIYDRVMRDVDYDTWSYYVILLSQRFKVEVEKILDLACGTGNLTLRLAKKGYDVTGVDFSGRMLEHARSKADEMKVTVPFLNAPIQSLGKLGLAQDFDMILCLYDSLNYLMDAGDVTQCFHEACRHLRKGGIFIFDVTTEYNLLHNFSGYTFAENYDDASYIWENRYSMEKKVCYSKVTIFQHINGKYTKSVEEHLQKIYATSWLTEQLVQCGFEMLGKFHDMTEEPVQSKCERIHFVCKKV